MWPKVIAQLFELLPHISRMVPLADRYLSSKSANDQALTTLSDEVRSDLGRVAKAHVDLAAHLDEFAGFVTATAADAKSARAAAESTQTRITSIERQLVTLRTLALVVLVLLVLVAALLVWLLVQHQH